MECPSLLFRVSREVLNLTYMVDRDSRLVHGLTALGQPLVHYSR